LAKDVGAELTIVNVVIVDESGINKREMAVHQQRLEEFVAKKVADVGTNLKIRRVVEAGQPYLAIVDRAENERVDLIVMSSHGRSGISRMLIGSVTDKVLRVAPCPVLVVPLEKEN
jgi:nucleotide-binding universal stress UspA family protein